ncbi:MAG TPA: NirA family protein [Candidatus Paceibacterota bacterium]|nr:NirA family protein [Candidatus Paceibacterota bacterium]
MSTTETTEQLAKGFTPEQKEYLVGFMEGIARRNLVPFVGVTADGSVVADPALGGKNLAAPAEEMIFGTPLADATKQERWKHEEHPLDGWDRILAHAEADKLPDEENTYRFRNFGMFFVGPVQNSLMLRCRIPAGELASAQLAGLADIADAFGNGKAAITTRSNIQIREIAPRNMVNVLTRLQSLGLTARGSGVDNVRNITASPTAGFDPQELIDTRPFAHALHHYILNHRDLYGLPRKFNVAFEGGGSVDTVADTNDIGFMAVRVGGVESFNRSIVQSENGSTVQQFNDLTPGIFFRVELCGITGHKQLARDAGILVKPSEAVAVSAAMIRVFVENGDRTDRKKARLKYLVDKWGLAKFLEETQKKLAFPLVKFPLEKCVQRPPALRHGHIGVYRQKQKNKNYIGVVIPVGLMSTRQMRRIADIAANYGSGQVRLTPWQNLLIPDIADGFVETVKRQLVRMGFHHEATNIAGGLVACTGNQGCKWAATDTKGHAVALAEHLNKRVKLDQPINLHLTGCPHSCAQHYIGDIGLQGVKVNAGGSSVEGYNIVFGGGCGLDSAIAKDVFKGISFSELPALLERVMTVYLTKRNAGESFAAFTRRHEVKQLQEMFST